MSARADDLRRISEALERAREVLQAFTAGAVDVEWKSKGDPVTEADTRVNDALLETLPVPGEGWLSEETADSPERLDCSRVWVVDPLDGTREFVRGIPEWVVSIGLVEDGLPVAGGLLNPSTGESLLGSIETGVTLNGQPVRVTDQAELDRMTVHASRSEVNRGEWERFGSSGFRVVPCGSVAYKLGLVAAGRTDATWTLVPKHEWDVAAGAALVRSAGGAVYTLDGQQARFNRQRPKLTGLIATNAALAEPIAGFLGIPFSAR